MLNEALKGKSKYQYEGFVATPPLWKDNSFGELAQFQLPQINLSSTLIPGEHFPQLHSNYVLGKRAEFFFELAIISSGEYQVLTSRIQISREKITIGELDFLLKNLSTNQIVHVELVYKFYIYDPSFSEELQRWIGPKRKDSLLQKIIRLKDHQLPLFHKKETRAALKIHGIVVENVEQKVFFPATLFVPKHLYGNSFPYINNDCLAGYWIHREIFNDKNYSEHLFFTPKKQDWPILPHRNKLWFSYAKIIDQVDEFIRLKRAPLMWMKTAEGKFERFFIVWW